MKISDYFKGNELTKGQSDLVEELEQFLIEDDCSVFLLKGHAGVGKTFLTAGITNYLQAIQRHFVLMAPTGKAAKVIANKTNKEAKTIHRIIYSYFDSDNIDVEKEVEGEPPVMRSKLKENQDSPDTVYLIDEASMVSNKYNKSELCFFGSGFLLDDLLEYINLNKGNKKIIFIGDDAQLPPVRNSFSPALSTKYVKETLGLNCWPFELSQVVRQQLSSGVITNANRLRRAMTENKFEGVSFDVSASDVEVLSGTDFLEQYLHLCANQVEKTFSSIIIAHTNVQVRDYNNSIRANLFSLEAPIQINERIICVSNFNHDDKFISNGEFGKVVKVLSNPELRTIEVGHKTHKGRKLEFVGLSFVDVEIEFMNDNGKPILIKTKILTNLLYDSSSKISHLEYKALYADFLQRNPKLNRKKDPVEFQKAKYSDPYLNVMQIKFGYAITCHKSQGSEWSNVFVDAFFFRPDKKFYLRWLYTAITRTSKNLYINKNLNFGLMLP
ncbi:AAA family ATPase [Thalassotalea sp. SU-HH00458]|uniref:ATP-dependent DNA helicase n=1 Tax=Thalassotalea sp. SU-HH00458 TaxID=3127657 RepID=UPI003108F1B5